MNNNTHTTKMALHTKKGEDEDTNIAKQRTSLSRVTCCLASQCYPYWLGIHSSPDSESGEMFLPILTEQLLLPSVNAMPALR